jgi:hypothetical protein
MNAVDSLDQFYFLIEWTESSKSLANTEKLGRLMYAEWSC